MTKISSSAKMVCQSLKSSISKCTPLSNRTRATEMKWDSNTMIKEVWKARKVNNTWLRKSRDQRRTQSRTRFKRSSRSARITRPSSVTQSSQPTKAPCIMIPSTHPTTPWTCPWLSGADPSRSLPKIQSCSVIRQPQVTSSRVSSETAGSWAHSLFRARTRNCSTT